MLINKIRPKMQSLMKEKEINPFLRCDVLQVKRAAEHGAERSLESAEAVFAALRARKNNF